MYYCLKNSIFFQFVVTTKTIVFKLQPHLVFQTKISQKYMERNLLMINKFANL